MNRFQYTLLSLSLGINLAFAGIWLFNVHKQHQMQRPERASLHAEIGVTPDQWRHISPLAEDFRNKSLTLGREIRTLRCRLLDRLAQPDPDMNRIRSIQEQLNFKTLELKNQALTLLTGEKAFLTPSQYAALIAAIRGRSACDLEGGHIGGSFLRVLSGDPAVSGE